MAMPENTWEVITSNEGGLIVRTKKDLSSPQLPERLAAGSQVKAVFYDDDTGRLRYQLLSGSGPASGWVSTRVGGKETMVRQGEAPAEETEKPRSVAKAPKRQSQPEDTSRSVDLQVRTAPLVQLRPGAAARAPPSNLYGMAVVRPGRAPAFAMDSRQAARLARAPVAQQRDQLEAAEDSDGERMHLCPECSLPMGDFGYADNKKAYLHGECKAKLMLREAKEDEEARQRRDATLKKKERENYNIGWKADMVPRNAVPASKFECNLATDAMCCVVLDKNSCTVRPVPTLDPAAAVNLEYLSIALQVRVLEGREPLFSLDAKGTPTGSNEPQDLWQVKRFEPAWLGGTSVGEVMFQADYHLKELSMGECEQPVLGMKSCFDLNKEEWHEKDWRAREWYVMKNAEIKMTQEGVLIPHVKMGVEAREQITGPEGVEDAKITRPDHPLVRYAEAFTHHFDLIAERKSCVYHLRELAKASIMAKYLMESGVELDDSWFNMAEEEAAACCLEIPQLWNERNRSQIRVQDGKLLNADSGFGASSHSLYGGVQFGLDKFPLSGARHSARMMSAGLAARSFVPPARHLSSTLSAGLATRNFQRSFGPMGVQPARVSAGVGLDKFALSGARQPARMMSAGLAARQFVQPARHLSATLSAGLATRQFQRSFGPMGVQPARVSAGVGLDKFALSGARQPARMMSAGLAARQFVQPARQLSATLSAGLATRQFQRSFGPMGVQPARVSAGVGMDKFALSGARQPARMMSAGLAARQFVQPARHLSATLSAGLATRQFQRSFGPMGVQPARVAGVDLNLNEFNLSAPTQAKRQDVAGQLAEGIDISSAFWSNVEGVDNTMFSKEDQSLLQRIFNPSLSDRREEGDRFVPPDTSCAYIQGLRSLVREEEAVQKQRVQHFNSNAFEVAAPGALFPASWRSSVEISCEAAVGKRGGCLSAVDFRAQAQVFEEALQKATPVFDKSAEDGSRFRVYRLGSLEVRTTQEMHGKETISAVFSARASAETVQHFGRRAIEEHEKIVKVTEYVEGSGAQYRCYVVAETERKNLIVTEVLNGAMKREENPKDLEDRNSLAKVLRTAECGNSGITVASLKKYQGDVYGRLSGQGAQSGLRTA